MTRYLLRRVETWFLGKKILPNIFKDPKLLYLNHLTWFMDQLSHFPNWKMKTLFIILSYRIVATICCYCLVTLSILKLILKCFLYLLSILYVLWNLLQAVSKAEWNYFKVSSQSNTFFINISEAKVAFILVSNKKYKRKNKISFLFFIFFFKFRNKILFISWALFFKAMITYLASKLVTICSSSAVISSLAITTFKTIYCGNH